ncbi:MAG: NAD(P)H-dependent oxidoreductase [Eubacteriales bacterium]|nr:NAD(P)H-dependent oxidoreductase [Eubacteriales bacterium]
MVANIKALILNGEMDKGIDLSAISQTLKDALEDRNYDVEEKKLKEIEIKPCMGCYACWIKTPGKCIIDDYGRGLVSEMINSQLIVYLTPVVYGGYSPELKKALDRIIPLLLPFFKKIKGEVHHPKRYDTYPDVLVLGITDKENYEEEVIFNELIGRNALNWYSTFKGRVIDIHNDSLETAVVEALEGRI